MLLKEPKKQTAYVNLEEYIGEMVRSGKCGPGDKIGTTAEIAKRFGLSSSTVRYSLQSLTAKGLLVRRPGLGTFVSEDISADGSLRRKRETSTNISLVSGSFYNNLYNLESEGTISDVGGVFMRVPKGNYTNFNFKNAVDSAVSLGDKKVSITIKNNKYYITLTIGVDLNESLSKLLNIPTSLEANTEYNINISELTQGVCINCDLIDYTQVLLNNKYSQILACVELSKVGEKTSYNPNNSLYAPIKNDYINSIRFWVTTDSKNINSGIYLIRMVIEII